MLEATLDITEARKALLAFPDAFDRQRPQLLGQIGVRLKERARADFLVKSRGGSGAGGIAWKAITPAEARRKQRGGFTKGIGVRTEDLLQSLTFRTQGTTSWGKPIEAGEVSVEFADQPAANAFNAERPLFPSTLPDSWYREIDRLNQAAVDQVARTVFPEG